MEAVSTIVKMLSQVAGEMPDPVLESLSVSGHTHPDWQMRVAGLKHHPNAAL